MEYGAELVVDPRTHEPFVSIPKAFVCKNCHKEIGNFSIMVHFRDKPMFYQYEPENCPNCGAKLCVILSELSVEQ